MKVKDGILSTLAYADIFEYPLKISEIHRFFHALRPAEFGEIRKALLEAEEIDNHGDYFFLSGRKSIVIKREMFEEESRVKLKRAKKITRILSYIPTVRYIAVSGSLAQKNSGPQDDIDLFFVARKDTVWITRLFINTVLLLLGQKRKKNVRVAPNKICPNMIVSESALSVPSKSQNLYIARELVNLMPIIDKENVHERLLASNKWIQSILPNVHIPQAKHTHKRDSKLLSLIDDVALNLQKKYMNITKEIVTKDVAKFHPRDTRKIIMSLFQKRLVHILGPETANRVIHQHDHFIFERK